MGIEFLHFFFLYIRHRPISTETDFLRDIELGLLHMYVCIYIYVCVYIYIVSFA